MFDNRTQSRDCVRPINVRYLSTVSRTTFPDMNKTEISQFQIIFLFRLGFSFFVALLNLFFLIPFLR